MKTERWSQIEQLFLRAIELPQRDRAEFLDQNCRGDEALRREVLSLLACDEPDAPLLNDPFLAVTGAEVQPGEVDAAGQGIGAYRLVRLLGRGGMGAVYLAVRDDDHYKKEVAIKLLKRGMDTDFMLSRFRKERQILANLDHPFIARLLDGGATADGLPYFVMEYVDGLPITGYCADHRLELGERLNLFRLVCEAVQYAHQNLVVHRDLKPGNILITKEGVPKLLDFGIAKLLSPDPGAEPDTATRTEQRMMTPHYASPEQVMGLAISTATDIYALGAVLYELLTHQRPHRFTSQLPAEIERTICNVEPEKPSVAVRRNTDSTPRMQQSQSRQLSGDLDNIVLMAMRKEPQRRYTSAAEFSEDINRYLQARPVMAREDRWTYRAGKFVRRNRLGVLAALLLVASLVGGIVTTTIQARRAERRFQMVRHIANDVLFDLYTQAERLPGSTALQASMIQTVVRYLDSLGKESTGDPALDFELAGAYRRVAAVEGYPGRSNLGQTALGLSHYRKAIEIYERLANHDQNRQRALPGIVAASLDANSIAAVLGDPQGARSLLEKAASVAEVCSRSGIELSPYTEVYLNAHLADDAEAQQGPLAAQAYFRKGAEVAEKWTRAQRTAETLGVLVFAYSRLGDSQAHGGDLHGAQDTFGKALKVAEEAFQRPDAAHQERYRLPGLHHTFGDMLGAPDDPNLGDTEGALAHYRTAADICEKLAAVDPKDVNARRNLSDSYRRLGLTLLAKNAAEALQHYRKALPITEALAASDKANIQYRSGVVHVLLGTGMALHQLGRNDEALQHLSRAIELQKSIESVAPNRVWLLRNTSRAYMATGDALIASGNDAAALEAYEQGLAAAERMLQRAPASLHHALDRAELLEATGRYYLALARRSGTGQARRSELKAQAHSWFQKSLIVWQDWTKRNVAVPYAARRQSQTLALIASSL